MVADSFINPLHICKFGQFFELLEMVEILDHYTTFKFMGGCCKWILEWLYLHVSDFLSFSFPFIHYILVFFFIPRFIYLSFIQFIQRSYIALIYNSCFTLIYNFCLALIHYSCFTTIYSLFVAFVQHLCVVIILPSSVALTLCFCISHIAESLFALFFSMPYINSQTF